MSKFKEAREKIRQVITAQEELTQRYYRSQQHLLILEEQIEAVLRQSGQVPPALQNEQQHLIAQVAGIQKELAATAEQRRKAYLELRELGAAQELVNQLNDQIPFLLLPVKVETRFVTVKHVTRGFTRAEVLDLPEDLMRPAVTNLLGSGLTESSVVEIPTLSKLSAKGQLPRLGHIVQLIRRGEFAPPGGKWLKKIPDKKELWVRIFPDDVFVDAHEELLTREEWSTAQNYWRSIWAAAHQYKVEKPASEEQARTNWSTNIREAWRLLSGKVSAPRANWILQKSKPLNFIPNPEEYPEVPEFPEEVVKSHSWTEAPVTRILPDHFVVRLYNGTQFKEFTGKPISELIALGFDPSHPDDKLFELSEDGLNLPEELEWISHFPAAIEKGLALRIELTDEEFRNGFEKLVVLGLRLAADEEQGKAQLENLLLNHRYKDTGIGILPQGSPTNHTDKKVDTVEDDQMVQIHQDWLEGKRRFTGQDTGDRLKDGQLLCDALGIDHEILEYTPHADQEDIREALAMNRLLWPATAGYFLSQFLFPMISKEEISQTQSYFTRFVSGRSLLPCLRIHNQPYGILVSTAFSKWSAEGSQDDQFYNNLHVRILKVLDRIWEEMAGSVIHANDSKTHADAFSDRFLQMLGLHASSVEFYVRSLVDYFFSEDVMTIPLEEENKFWEIIQRLKTMGFHFEEFDNPSRFFDMLYTRKIRQLDGPVIDELPLSETRGLQMIADTKKHYLQWLADSKLLEEIRSGWEALEEEKGLPLLYLLVRQSLLQAYLKTSIKILQDAARISPVAELDFEREEVEENRPGSYHDFLLRRIAKKGQQEAIQQLVRQEWSRLVEEGISRVTLAAFNKLLVDRIAEGLQDQFLIETVKAATDKLTQRMRPQLNKPALQMLIKTYTDDLTEVIDNKSQREVKDLMADRLIRPKKWSFLSENYGALTDGKSMLAYIEEQLASPADPAIKELAELRSALELLKDLPTARLERLLAEHIDLCNYRLDAWWLGLVNRRLQQLRAVRPTGIFLGAFGYLEDLRPGSRPAFEVIEQRPAERITFGQRPPALNEIVLPLLPFRTIESRGLNLDLLLKNAFVDLGEAAESQLRYEQEYNRIEVPPPLDQAGEGFIHTPSLAHAASAAILRSGYASFNTGNAEPKPDDPFAVNLSSNRVRKALFFLEGMQNGQELAALLGYQFERAIHNYADKTDPVVDFISQAPTYLLELRKRFPLLPDQKTTANGQEVGEPPQQLNVVNGLSLLAHRKRSQNNQHWSKGIISNLPAAHQNLLDEELNGLEESLDALSDLLMAESVFQMSRGNPERAAAALRTLNDGGNIQDTEVIKTVRKGFHFVHRLAIPISAGNEDSSLWTGEPSAEASLNPSLNHWLAQQLPDPEKILIEVHFPDQSKIQWPIVNLGVQAIDLVKLTANNDFYDDNSHLSILIRKAIREEKTLLPQEVIELDYRSREGFTGDQYSLYEVQLLLNTLAKILESSRPMTPADLKLISEASGEAGEVVLESLKSRLSQVLTSGAPHSLFTQNENLKSLVEQMALFRDVEPVSEVARGIYDKLFQALVKLAGFGGIKEALPKVSILPGKDNIRDLLNQAQRLLEVLPPLLETAGSKLKAVRPTDGIARQLEQLDEIGQMLMGSSFRFFPEFIIGNRETLDQAAVESANENPLLIEEWLQGVSLVRNKVHSYQQLLTYRELFNTPAIDHTLKILQLPLGADQWVGLHPPTSALLNGDTVSLVLEVEEPLLPTDKMIGLMIDEWTEIIPDRTVDTGVTFNYNQPDAEAPQALILAVSPRLTGSWNWNDLMDTVTDTIQMAKKRAVEPDMIKESQLAHFLPMIFGPINDQDLTPNLDFAKNIQLANS